ncbi:MAG: SAM-dependent methyltransferase [Firmicutes bacterium HGW-Firmicutes-15]|nr:MAG: SAM-dependent methyltransferase [Firmicutes bacterium HGW-Firmicutes-15]
MNTRDDFDKIANEIFFPIYEVIAKNALKMSGQKSGACLDVGCGGGHLGLSVARASDMHITLMDIKEDSLKIADKRIKDWGLEDRSSTLVGDVRKISHPDNCFNLVVSRGSIGFWGDKDEMKQAFSEIYRVLAPNGTTYIGKGFGSAELATEIIAKMKVLHPEWPKSVQDASNGFRAEDYAEFLRELGIEADIINDERGVWVMMKKTT